MYRIWGLILIVLLSLCPMVASEENNDSESNNQDTTIERVGPEFFFDCREEASRPQVIPPGRMHHSYEVRPDLPSGDIVKHLGCILQNPNDFNITIELTVSSDVDIWSPDEYCVESYSYRYDYQDGIWDYYPNTFCNYGQWIISSQLGMQNNTIELSKNETLYPHLSIYADSYLNSTQPGWQEINLTTRITKTQWSGDDETLCINCTAINYTSTQFFNEWWNIDIYANLGNCNWHNRGYYTPDMQVVYYTPDMQVVIEDFCNDVEMANAVTLLIEDDFIEVRCFQEQKYVYIQWNTNAQTTRECDFQIDTYWQQLFNSSKLNQAKMLDNQYGDDDYYFWYGLHHYEEYIGMDTNEQIDYWGSRQCPEQIPITISMDIMGNINFTKNGEIELISHQYSLDDGLTIQNISNQTFEISSYETPNLAYAFPLSQSDEENLLVIIEGRVILENESYDKIIIGSCLTGYGADSLNEIFEDSALTMGITGGPLQRFSNSIAYTIGVDSFVVVGFFSMCIPPILYLVLTRLVKRVNEEF